MASYAVTRGCTALGHSYGNKRQPAQVVHGEGVGRVARWWCADHECQRGGCCLRGGCFDCLDLHYSKPKGEPVSGERYRSRGV